MGEIIDPQTFVSFALEAEESLTYITIFRNWCYLLEYILGHDTPHFSYDEKHATVTQATLYASIKQQKQNRMIHFHEYRNNVRDWCRDERNIAMKWEISNSSESFPPLKKFVPVINWNGQVIKMVYKKNLQSFFEDMFKENTPVVFMKYFDMCLQHVLYCTHDLHKKNVKQRTILRGTLNCFNKYVQYLITNNAKEIQTAKKSMKASQKKTKIKKSKRTKISKIDKNITSFPFRKYSAEELLF